MCRCCIIVVYFGSWPAWFSAWLRSCSTNRNFQWLIFTDLQAPAITPVNVRIEAISVSELEHRVSAMLEVPFVLSRGYKLVDLKPAYGELFQGYLEGFDFWGYTDLDVIYGNLSAFFTPDRLSAHDVLSPSDRLLVGHLTLLRNTPEICRLYRQCPDVVQLLCRETHEGFDEKGFHQLVMQLAHRQQIRVFLRDMKAEDIILRLSGRRRFLIVWRKGRLYDVAGFREICHFHFMESKWKDSFAFYGAEPTDKLISITAEALAPVRTLCHVLRLLQDAALCTARTVPWYLRKFAKIMFAFLAHAVRRDRLR